MLNIFNLFFNKESHYAELLRELRFSLYMRSEVLKGGKDAVTAFPYPYEDPCYLGPKMSGRPLKWRKGKGSTRWKRVGLHQR